MTLRVLPATEADIPRSVAIESVAYGISPTIKALVPGPVQDDSNFRANQLIDQRRADPSNRWMKVVDDDLSKSKPEGGSDHMVAFASWWFWTTRESLPQAMPTRVWGPGMNAEACELHFGTLTRRWWARFQGKPHLYLKLLHTDPAHQRRGAGGMLLDWGNTESDKTGLPIYLEATEVGYPLYLKYGYREVDRMVNDLTKWGGPPDATVVLMMREPLNQEAVLH